MARLKAAMFRAVDKYGYDHPTVRLISSMIDPLISAMSEVQLHKARRLEAMRSERRANGSAARDQLRGRLDERLNSRLRENGALKIGPKPSRN